MKNHPDLCKATLVEDDKGQQDVNSDNTEIPIQNEDVS